MNITSFVQHQLGRIWFASLFAMLLLGASVGTVFGATQNNTFVVTWSTSNVNNDCSASGGLGGWAGGKTLGGDMTFSAPNPAGSYTFSFTCTGAAGSDYDGVPITANASLVIDPVSVRIGLSRQSQSNPLETPTTLEFTTSRTLLNSLNGSKTATLTWRYSDPRGTCTASEDWSGPREASGSATIGNANFDPGTNEVRYYTISCSAPRKPTLTRRVSIVHEGPSCTRSCVIR